MLLVLRSGLGDPTNPNVLRQAAIVTQSVFSHQELLKFMKQTRLDKKIQLRQLANLVAGIRVFNWDTHRDSTRKAAVKFAIGIDDLPSMLSNAVDASVKNLDSLRQATHDKGVRLTRLAEKLLYTESGSKVATAAEVEAIKFGLINVKQFQIYTDSLWLDLKNISHRLAALDEELLKRIEEIQRTLVEGGQLKLQRLAIPATQVYPLFLKLAETWKGFQEETLVLSRADSLRRLLYDYTRCLAKLPYKTLVKKLGDEAIDDAHDTVVDRTDFVCKLVSPGDVPDYDKLPLQYGGFCPVALVSGQGFVLPGNPQLGVLKHEGKYYAASNADRVSQFGKNPDLFIVAIKKLVKETPCLLKLLNVMEEEEEAKTEPRFGTVGVQTVLHPETRSHDPNYRWNEWDLRREALRLAEMKHKANLGCQTVASGARKEAGSQMTGLRDTQTQTLTSTGTTTSSFVTGLRGQTRLPVKHVSIPDLCVNPV